MTAQAFAPGTFQGATVALTTAATLITSTEAHSVKWEGVQRTAVDTTHLGTTGGGKTAIPGDIIDWGTITVMVKYSTQLDYLTLFKTTGKCDTLTVTFPKRPTTCGAALPTTAGTAAFGVVLIGIDTDFPSDAIMMATYKFKVTGEPTFVAAVV